MPHMESPGAGFSGARAASQCGRDAAEDTALHPRLQHLRFQQDVEALHRLGPRPLGELILELIERLAGDDPERRAFVEARLHRYAALDREIVAALGGDSFAPRPMHVVSGSVS